MFYVNRLLAHDSASRTFTWYIKPYFPKKLRKNITKFDVCCSIGLKMTQVWLNFMVISTLTTHLITDEPEQVIFFIFGSLRPINNPSVIKGQVFLGWTNTKLGLMCFAQGHSAVTPARLKPTAPLSRVKHSTTESMPSLSPLSHPTSVVCW